MKMRGLLIALLALGAAGANAETPFYAGGGFGITDFDQKADISAPCDPFECGFGSDERIPIDLGGDSFGYDIFGGYEINPRWAIETGFIHFGSRKENVITEVVNNDRFKFESRAVYLNTQYHVPIGEEISLDLSAGWAFAKAKASRVARDDSPFVDNRRDSYSDNGFMLGLGVTVKITEMFYIRGAANYFDITYDEGGDDDASLTSVGDDFIDEPIRLGVDLIVDF